MLILLIVLVTSTTVFSFDREPEQKSKIDIVKISDQKADILEEVKKPFLKIHSEKPNGLKIPISNKLSVENGISIGLEQKKYLRKPEIKRSDHFDRLDKLFLKANKRFDQIMDSYFGKPYIENMFVSNKIRDHS